MLAGALVVTLGNLTLLATALVMSAASLVNTLLAIILAFSLGEAFLAAILANAVFAFILAGIIVAVLATAFAHALFAIFLTFSLEGLQAANSQIVGNCASIGRSFPHLEYL